LTVVHGHAEFSLGLISPSGVMFEFLKRRAETKRRANIRAEALIARHGREAWPVVYGICRDPGRNVEDRRFYYLVRTIIERRLGIPPRVDTATRYLERR
jgi:hypothetical protein